MGEDTDPRVDTASRSCEQVKSRAIFNFRRKPVARLRIRVPAGGGRQSPVIFGASRFDNVPADHAARLSSLRRPTVASLAMQNLRLNYCAFVRSIGFRVRAVGRGGLAYRRGAKDVNVTAFCALRVTAVAAWLRLVLQSKLKRPGEDDDVHHSTRRG